MVGCGSGTVQRVKREMADGVGGGGVTDLRRTDFSDRIASATRIGASQCRP